MSIIIRKAILEDLKEVYKLFELEYNNFDPDLNVLNPKNWTFFD